VLHVARDHQLAAPVEALDDEGPQIGSSRVERGCVPGGATADDDHFAYAVLSHAFQPSPLTCIKRPAPAEASSRNQCPAELELAVSRLCLGKEDMRLP